MDSRHRKPNPLLPKSQVNRQIVRAEALDDDIDRLTGTSLDKGVGQVKVAR